MQSSYLLINGIRIHYLHWDFDGPGRPVLLLHGLASNARIWEKVAPLLARSGLVPLAPDWRGHGLSDKPDGEYAFGPLLRDITAFIEVSQLEQPLLVGHSMGAMLALDYAARAPFGPRSPAGLFLVDGGMAQLDDSPGATWEKVSLNLAPPRLEGMPVETFLAHLSSLYPKWNLDDGAIQAILANFEIDGDETISPRLSYPRHMQLLRAIWDFKTYRRFDRLRCPVFMAPARPPEPLEPLEAEHLELKQRGLNEARRRISGLQVYWFEDCIHDVPLYRPEELAAQIASFAASLDER